MNKQIHYIAPTPELAKAARHLISLGETGKVDPSVVAVFLALNLRPIVVESTPCVTLYDWEVSNA